MPTETQHRTPSPTTPTSEPAPERDFIPTTWLGKFGCAFRGVYVGVRRYGLASFAIHIPVMAGVLAMGVWVRVTWTEWYLLILCITVVLAAELTNSAFEALARAVTDEYDPHVRDALDTASGVVFATSLGAAIVGAMILFG